MAVSLHQLPAATVRLISSTQVITSVVSIVKELLENALDAKANNIDIRLDNFGFDKIEIRDNGTGIPVSDRVYMAVPHYTSKISNHLDLETLTSYGFRGEALGSLCAVADVCITTKTDDDDIGMTYTLSQNGEIISNRPSHLAKGTTLTVTNLFKSVPVRRQYYSTARRRHEELKKIEDLLLSFGIIRPDVRIVLSHNKQLIWQKTASIDYRSSLLQILGRQTVTVLEHIQRNDAENEISIDAFLPQATSDIQLTSRAHNDRSFMFVNKRPVILKEIEKLVRQYYGAFVCKSPEGLSRHPVVFISIEVSPSQLDVNVEPNKMTVLFHHMNCVLAAITAMLDEYYGKLENSQTAPKNALIEKNISKNSTHSSQNETLKPLENDFIENKMHKPLARTLHSKILESVESNSTSTRVIPNSIDLEQPILPLSNLDESRISTPELINKINSSVVNHVENQAVLNIDKYKEKSDHLPEIDQLDDFEHKNNGEIEAPLTERVVSTNSSLSTDSTKNSLEMEDDWSKGHLKNKDGHTLQPVQLLVPGETKSSNSIKRSINSETNDKSPCKKKTKLHDKDGQPTLYDLIDSKPVKKSDTPFLNFSKEIRPQVLKDNAGINFEMIGNLIRQKWNSLSPEDKQKYEVSCKTSKRSETVVKDSRRSGAKNSIKPVKKMGIGSVLEKLLALPQTPKSEKKKIVSKKVVNVSFSMEIVKTKFIHSDYNSQIENEETVLLIGQLKSNGSWLLLKGTEICLINHFRIEESLLFSTMMSKHILPMDDLETPIVVGESISLCHILMKLNLKSCPPDPYLFIDDERLSSNGFEIRIHQKDLGTEPKFEIMKMASCIPYYGISDLLEVLKGLNKDIDVNLGFCRPIKVIHYFKSEAVRMSRQVPAWFSKSDMLDLLHRLKLKLPDNLNCIHQHPFFCPVYDLSSAKYIEETEDFTSLTCTDS